MPPVVAPATGRAKQDAVSRTAQPHAQVNVLEPERVKVLVPVAHLLQGAPANQQAGTSRLLDFARAIQRHVQAAVPAVYRIAHITQVGDTVRIIERTLAAVPISDAEWDERTYRYRRVREDHPGAECEPSEQPRPASKPLFRWIGQSMDQRLWVEVYTPAGFVFEVFDPAGRLIGQLPAPTRDRRVWDAWGRLDARRPATP